MAKDGTSEISDPERAGRLANYLEHLNLIARTFATLALEDRASICDTLLSLVASLIEAEHGFVLLPENDRVVPVAVRGAFTHEPLTDPRAAPYWSGLLASRTPTLLDAGELERHVPWFDGGIGALALMTMDVRDQAVALLAVGRTEPGSLTAEDVSLLHAAAGIGALALSGGEAVRVQRRYAIEAEQESRAKERALADLDNKLDIIEHQNREIMELSLPVLELWNQILVVPVIGTLDTRRSAEMMERLLSAIVADHARFVLLDLTGATLVDTHAAQALVGVVQSARLLGATGVVTGVRPALAHTMVQLGIDLTGMRTTRSLREGLQLCLEEMNTGSRQGLPTK